MKKYKWLFIFYFLAPLSFYSQPKLTSDSLKLKFQKDSAHIYRFKKFRPYFAIDQRNSWIKNEKSTRKVPVAINGLQAGIILQEKHTLGFGYYTINKQSVKPVKITDQNNKVTYEELFMRYITAFYEYVIFDTRFFELDLPIEIGVGRYIYNLKDETKSVLLWKEEGPAKLTSGGVSITLKPFKWIGVKGMAGYRFVAFNAKSNLNFNGIYYSYGIWADLRQIYRDIKFYGFVRPKYRKKVKAILASNG